MARRSPFGFSVLRRMPPVLVPLIPFQVVRFHGRSTVHSWIATGPAVTCQKKNWQFVTVHGSRVVTVHGCVRHKKAHVAHVFEPRIYIYINKRAVRGDFRYGEGEGVFGKSSYKRQPKLLRSTTRMRVKS